MGVTNHFLIGLKRTAAYRWNSHLVLSLVHKSKASQILGPMGKLTTIILMNGVLLNQNLITSFSPLSTLIRKTYFEQMAINTETHNLPVDRGF